MKYIKEKARDTFGYETTEISKEEALEYVSEEILGHRYNDLIRGCVASAALEKVDFGLYIGVSRYHTA